VKEVKMGDTVMLAEGKCAMILLRFILWRLILGNMVEYGSSRMMLDCEEEDRMYAKLARRP
jgi:hypothetical protein